MSQPMCTAFVLVRGEDDEVGGMVTQVAKHGLHRVALLRDDFADIDAELRQGGAGTAHGQ